MPVTLTGNLSSQPAMMPGSACLITGSSPALCTVLGPRPALPRQLAQHQPDMPPFHHLQAVDGQTCGSQPQQPESGRTGALFSAQSEYTQEYPEKPLIQQRTVQPGHFDLRPVPAVSLETTHGEPAVGAGQVPGSRAVRLTQHATKVGAACCEPVARWGPDWTRPTAWARQG